MILRELLYRDPRTAEVPAVPTACNQNFSQIFYQKRTTVDKNYQKIIYGEAFYWFVLLIKLIYY